MKYISKSKRPCESKSLTERLPRDYPWKILGWLAKDLSQYLGKEDLDEITQIIRNRDVDGYLDLSEKWGLQCMPYTDGTKLEKAARYQLAALLKKFRFPTEKSARKARAIDIFMDGESSCKHFNLEGWKMLAVGAEPWLVDAFTYARSFMRKMLGEILPPLSVMTERSRHGPGATLDTVPGQVSSFNKFVNWPYQCTRAALGIARWAIENDERWLGALEDDYRSVFDIPKHVILNRQMFWDSVLQVVDGNRIAFVPKNARVERSIAIEPTMNLYLQLGVDGVIRRRLKRWGVDLNDQRKNQWLALSGSVGSVDPYVTIDLRNASNTISLMLCYLLLPDEWYDYLIALRSPMGELEGSYISYEMIGSMGNGYTFALESAIFTSLIYGVMVATNGCFDRDEFAVFGDDLIVRQSLVPRLIQLLTNSGFSINVEKSFLEGPIRESCGTDWFQGVPVRPVFLEDTPSEVDELFSDLNRLKRILEVRWGIEESVVEWGISRWIPESFRDCVGPYSDEAFDSYIHCASPKLRRKGWVYQYRQVVRQSVDQTHVNDFGFRKLMHDLHPVPLPSLKWEKRKLTGTGGRFKPKTRGAFVLSKKCSAASVWQSEYNEYRPTKVRTNS